MAQSDVDLVVMHLTNMTFVRAAGLKVPSSPPAIAYPTLGLSRFGRH